MKIEWGVRYEDGDIYGTSSKLDALQLVQDAQQEILDGGPDWKMYRGAHVVWRLHRYENTEEPEFHALP